MGTYLRRLALTAAITSATCVANADENIFGYTLGAEVIPVNNLEAQQWVTGRFGKADGHYAAYDIKTRLDYGVAENTQASLHVNQRVHDYADVAGRNLSRWNFSGLQGTLKYMAMSPFLDDYGLAFNFEPGFSLVDRGTGDSRTEINFDTRVIFQKNFLDNTMIYAANLAPGFDLVRVPQSSGEKEFVSRFTLEFTQGISYRIMPNWFVGLENRIHTAAPEFEKFDHVDIAVGPALHYGSERWWGTLAVLPQVYGSPSNQGDLDLDRHEKIEVRLKVAYNF